MTEIPDKDELDRAFTVLREFSQRDVSSIKTLSHLLEVVPSVGRNLFTMLRQYGETSRFELPLDVPGKTLQLGPILTLYKEIGDSAIELSGRDQGVRFQKWDEKKRTVTDFADPNLLMALQASVSMEIPTLIPFVLHAMIHRESETGRIDEFIAPADFPVFAAEQQKYARYLQELVLDLLLVLAEG